MWNERAVDFALQKAKREGYEVSIILEVGRNWEFPFYPPYLYMHPFRDEPSVSKWGSWGACDHTHRRIVIAATPNANEDIITATLYHELGHAAGFDHQGASSYMAIKTIQREQQAWNIAQEWAKEVGWEWKDELSFMKDMLYGYGYRA
jgi:hypothetical protein